MTLQTSSVKVKVVKSDNTVKVTTVNGLLTPVTPITLKNQMQYGSAAKRVRDLSDVSEVDVTTGATLVYNQNNTLYEVKQLDIDGGIF